MRRRLVAFAGRMIRLSRRAAPAALHHRVIALSTSCGIAAYRRRTSWWRCEMDLQLRRSNELTRLRDEGAASNVHAVAVEWWRPGAWSACASPLSALMAKSTRPLVVAQDQTLAGDIPVAQQLQKPSLSASLPWHSLLQPALADHHEPTEPLVQSPCQPVAQLR